MSKWCYDKRAFLDFVISQTPHRIQVHSSVPAILSNVEIEFLSQNK